VACWQTIGAHKSPAPSQSLSVVHSGTCFSNGPSDMPVRDPHEIVAASAESAAIRVARRSRDIRQIR
jgi:hypothetical protein